MGQIKRSLWKRFVAIAQPYFFPDIRRGGWAMLLLLIMLLGFLFGVLFLIVSGLALAANQVAPDLTAKIASGLLSTIAGIFHSQAWLIVAGLIIVPLGVFILFGRHLRGRGQAWALLATVLILSLSVTGILWSKSVMLVGVVLGYSLLGTLLTVLMGRRLVGLNFNQLHYEADFRYSLVTENCRSLVSITSASVTAGASWIITIMYWNCGDRTNGNCCVSLNTRPKPEYGPK